ncbi:membrane protein [Prevotella sp. CAG:924]|nr:membrane protein [Prevotella sp. CAG:924]
MGAKQCVFGRNGVYASAPFVVGLAYRLVDFGKLAQLLQIIVHLLVADDRESLMPLKLHIFIFIQYRLAVVVQLDDKPFGGLYGGDFYKSTPKYTPNN